MSGKVEIKTTEEEVEDADILKQLIPKKWPNLGSLRLICCCFTHFLSKFWHFPWWISECLALCLCKSVKMSSWCATSCFLQVWTCGWPTRKKYTCCLHKPDEYLRVHFEFGAFSLKLRGVIIHCQWLYRLIRQECLYDHDSATSSPSSIGLRNARFRDRWSNRQYLFWFFWSLGQKRSFKGDGLTSQTARTLTGG